MAVSMNVRFLHGRTENMLLKKDDFDNGTFLWADDGKAFPPWTRGVQALDGYLQALQKFVMKGGMEYLCNS